MIPTNSTECIRYFKTEDMLEVLGLHVGHDGRLWSVKEGKLIQELDWNVEVAIAFVVGRMLQKSVRERICNEAAVWSGEVRTEASYEFTLEEVQGKKTGAGS